MNTNLIIIAIFAILQLFIGIIAANDPKHCFDVLDKLPKDEIRAIHRMKFQDIATTHPAADILSCYLADTRHGDKTIAEQSFDIYKKCNDYKKDNFQNIGYDQLDELVELGLPYGLESNLRDAIKFQNTKGIKEAILYIQEVMSKKIELSKEYKDYKDFILKKIKPKRTANPLRSNEKLIDEKSAKEPLHEHESDEKIAMKKFVTEPKENLIENPRKPHLLSEQQIENPHTKSCQKSIHNFFLVEFIIWMLN